MQTMPTLHKQNDERAIDVNSLPQTTMARPKVVNSTGAKDVIPAIAGIYNNYGNPDSHRTDNGPPFNSKEFSNFSDGNTITHRTSFPYHPQANPVETFMKPLDDEPDLFLLGEPADEPAVNPQDELAVNPQDEPAVNPQDVPAVNPQDEPAVNPQNEPAVNPQDEPAVN
ncbi:uncharacterized protein LOC144749978 [Ciona intestinalis]